MERTALITGGAGYIGALACRGTAAGGSRRARARLPAARPGDDRRRPRGAGVEVIRGDIRDGAAREAALHGRRRGRPPRRDRRRSRLRARPGDRARDQRRGHPRARRRSATGRASSASCSPPPARTTGAWPTRRCRSTRTGALAPGLALRRAEGRDRAAAARGSTATALAADLPALRDGLRRRPAHALRPDRQRVHARPLGRSQARGLRRAVLAARTSTCATPRARSAPCSRRRATVAGEVFNVGDSRENYRKLDLVEAIRRADPTAARSTYVQRDEDPRDYKVSFDKIRADLGFETLMTVPDGIGEIARALDARPSATRTIRASATDRKSMSEIAPGIHRIEEDLGARFMAQYVLMGDERTLLVDTGLCGHARHGDRALPRVDRPGGGRARRPPRLACRRRPRGLQSTPARALAAHARVVRRERPRLDRVQRPHARRELPLVRALRVLAGRRGARLARARARRRCAHRRRAARRRDAAARAGPALGGARAPRAHPRAHRALARGRAHRAGHRRGARRRHPRPRRAAADPAADLRPAGLPPHDLDAAGARARAAC